MQPGILRRVRAMGCERGGELGFEPGFRTKTGELSFTRGLEWATHPGKLRARRSPRPGFKNVTACLLLGVKRRTSCIWPLRGLNHGQGRLQGEIQHRLRRQFNLLAMTDSLCAGA